MAYESLCDKDVLWESPTEEQLELKEEEELTSLKDSIILEQEIQTSFG